MTRGWHFNGGLRLKLMMLLLGLVLFALCKPAAGQEQATANATQPAPGARWVDPSTGMAFRWIAPGCFTMGSPAAEKGRDRDEGPQHKVCLSGFWLGETEVTQGQWQAVTGDNPSLIKNGETYPVDMVSWNMAKEYAAKLGAMDGGNFRLPTEAEWEYACRAGTRAPYFFGDTITHDQASFDKRFSLPAAPLEPRRKTRRKKHAKPAPRIWPNMHTSAAASFPANAFGLYDMHGNLWEWCEDVYDAGYYARSPRDNPRNESEGPARVLRGGSWVTRGVALRSANRSRGWPDMRTAFYGFRLVRVVSAPAQPPAQGSRPDISNR
jgi:formylglycine-generating enzyme required for sulfatase activity